MPKNGKSGPHLGSTQFAQQLESTVTAPPLVGCVVWSHSPCSVPSLKEFLPVTSDELKIIVNPPTNCDLDAVPTRLMKEQLDCIITLLVDIVNKSLCSCVFPDCLKQAIVVPL